MGKTYKLQYSQTPSALRYMLFAFLPKKGFRAIGKIPKIVARWENYKIDSSVKKFNYLTGIQCEKTLHPIFLHTVSFRLAMSVLTHSVFPESIWSVLQIRNVIVQRQALSSKEFFDIEVRTGDHRILQKGLEVDLHTNILVSGKVVWESINTFYVRGQFGSKNSTSPGNTPKGSSHSHSTWRFLRGGGQAFGSLTGDYNGVHIWNWYAKMFGFKSAFSHPQRILGQIANKLITKEALEKPLKLEFWLKGPIYYDSNLELRVSEENCGTTFYLYVNADKRPAIIGQYSNIL